MTTTLTLGPNAWPLSIKASMTAEGVTLLVQSDDWREAVTISQTRAETLAVLRQAIAAVEALQCGYGWGCTDLECTEHGAGLRTGDVIAAEDAPMIGERLAVMADDPASCVTRIDVVSDRWAGPEDAA